MSKTNIEYGDRTWNVLTGCTVKSEGCKHCWAQKMAKRLKAMGRPEYQDAVDEKGNWTGKIRLVPKRLNEPLTWRKPQHVLVEYMGDLFHKDVPWDYVRRVFNVMMETPQHTYQTLTKRPEIMEADLKFNGISNVILGVSIENYKRANERLPYMRALAERGWRTWVSYEPALGPVDWKGWEFLNQLICGGESGPGARPMHPDWARSARDFCVGNGIPFFFKQWGSHMNVWECDSFLRWVQKAKTHVYTQDICIDQDGRVCKNGDNFEKAHYPIAVMSHVSKNKAGHILDHLTWSQMPK